MSFLVMMQEGLPGPLLSETPWPGHYGPVYGATQLQSPSSDINIITSWLVDWGCTEATNGTQTHDN